MNLREISSSVSNSLSDRISSVMQSDFLQSLENFLSNGGKDIKMIVIHICICLKFQYFY